jgi:Protein of unknown function (DUF4239)
MNSIVVSSMVFMIVFGGALVGMALRRVLPEDHLSSDAKDVVKLAMGLIATMAALVLGMLVSTAKSSYDTRKNEVAEMSARIVAIDQLLANYGPESKGVRAELREVVVVGLNRIWPGEATGQVDLRPKEDTRDFYSQLQALAPKNDSQGATKAEAISMAANLRLTRWRIFVEAEQTSMSIPLLAVLVAWLVAIFIGFGLFAPPNPTVIVTLAICALSVSAAIFIIMEMYTPFCGVLKISSAPIRETLNQIGH